MPTITLDDIRQAAEEKFGNTVIPCKGGDVELLNPIRLKKAVRDELTSLDEIEDLDAEEKLERIIHLAAKTEAQAKRLVASLDLAELATVVEMWTRGQQVGEASTSPS